MSQTAYFGPSVLAATTPLAAAPTLLAADRDHSSRGRSYSYCCRQRPLLLQPYLLFLRPEETTPLAAATPLVAAGRDYSSCHPDANGVGSEMSGGGAKAGGGGRAKRTDNLPFQSVEDSYDYQKNKVPRRVREP